MDLIELRSNKLQLKNLKDPEIEEEVIQLLNEIVEESKITIDTEGYRLLLSLFRKWKTYLLHFHSVVYKNNILDHISKKSEILKIIDEVCLINHNQDVADIFYPKLKRYLKNNSDKEAVCIGLKLSAEYYDIYDYLDLVFHTLNYENREVADTVVSHFSEIVDEKYGTYAHEMFKNKLLESYIRPLIEAYKVMSDASDLHSPASFREFQNQTSQTLMGVT
ncbi:MAG: hypothetical protein RIF33_23675 [Cyclobacteriaceae bacterium]